MRDSVLLKAREIIKGDIMPIITMQTNISLSNEIMNKIVEEFIQITTGILRKKKSVIVVKIDYDKNYSHWYVNGENINNSNVLFALNILITKGTNTKEEKSKWIKEAWRIMSQLIGDLSSPNYISINEIDADNWGFNGKTQEERLKQ